MPKSWSGRGSRGSAKSSCTNNDTATHPVRFGAEPSQRTNLGQPRQVIELEGTKIMSCLVQFHCQELSRCVSLMLALMIAGCANRGIDRIPMVVNEPNPKFSVSGVEVHAYEGPRRYEPELAGIVMPSLAPLDCVAESSGQIIYGGDLVGRIIFLKPGEHDLKFYCKGYKSTTAIVPVHLSLQAGDRYILRSEHCVGPCSGKPEGYQPYHTYLWLQDGQTRKVIAGQSPPS